MENKNKNIADYSGYEETINIREEHLLYLKKLIDMINDKEGEQFLLLVERLIFLTIEFYISNPSGKLKFDLFDETTFYVEFMNKKAVEYFNMNKLDEASKVIARIVDLLNQKTIAKLFSDNFKLFESKILTYNNLSCIYRKLGKLANSVKVVTFAIELEEKLVASKYGNSSISIISTYLNKSAILSEMKKHESSKESVDKALEYLRQAEGIQDLQESERMHLKQLKMLAYYNLAVEHEHSSQTTDAINDYKLALEIAKELGKTEVIAKIERTLTILQKN